MSDVMDNNDEHPIIYILDYKVKLGKYHPYR